MGAYRKRVGLKLYRPPVPDQGWPSAAFLAVVLLALVAFVFGCLWLARTLDQDARRRERDRELRELDDREIRLRATKQRMQAR